jgi:sugar phosphate isomerase/epimerase
MSLSQLPLSYCTNVHPGQTVAEVEHGLTEYAVPMRQRFGELAAGLWLARPVVSELLESADALANFKAKITQLDLSCYTLNTFPFGNFHDERVKENVYLPDWSDERRLAYTVDCARVLAEIIDEDIEGSLSTVPLGFKGFDHPADFTASCADQLIRLARELEKIYTETGRRIRLAIEPEPFCVIETTPETIAFFEQLRSRAADQGALELASEYLGVCYDVCHQSVEFEDVAESIRTLRDNDIRINKVHITCAIRIEQPNSNAAARELLAQYVEPRYLHQTMARNSAGEISRLIDLTEQMTRNPTDGFEQADEWRVHYHVPVNADSLGPLQTTRDDLKLALKTVAELDYAPHLEVETYTWEVLPDGNQVSLVDGFTAELEATRELLDGLI